MPKKTKTPSAQAKLALACFLELGAERTLTAVAKIRNNHCQTVERWSRDFGWAEEAEHFDAEVAAKAIAAAKEKAVAEHRARMRAPPRQQMDQASRLLRQCDSLNGLIEAQLERYAAQGVSLSPQQLTALINAKNSGLALTFSLMKEALGVEQLLQFYVNQKNKSS